MRIRLTASALALGLALGCADSSGDGDPATGDVGGTLLVGMPLDPPTLFPLLAPEEVSIAVTHLLFDKLAKIDENLTTFGDASFKPQLAQRWEWSADSLAITFHLDPAARFHDGRPVTAGDVRYTFNLAKNPALGSTFTPLVQNIDSVSVIDSLTPKVWYKRRSPTQFYDAVYQLAPVPEHVYGKVPPAEMRTAEITRTPVGTGRFRFVRWEPGVRLELVADTTHARGRPKLDRVIFMLNQAPTAAAASILAGQLDFFSAFPIDQLGALDSGTVARSIPYPQNGYGFMGFNRFAPGSNDRPHPILGDIAVRRAISMALDRQGMLRNVFKDQGMIAYGPFPPRAILGDTTIRPPQYDTTAAKAALDAAGWRVGPDGVRMKNGRPLALEILVPSTSLPRLRYAELMQEQLNRVGFRIELARLAGPQFGPRMGQRQYDMVIITLNTDPTVAGIQQFWGTPGIAAGSNFLRYQSRVADAHFDSAGRAATPADVRRHVSAALRQIVDDVPAVWLFESATVAALHRRVEPQPFGKDGWWGNLADWSIPADKRIDRDRVGLTPTAR